MTIKLNDENRFKEDSNDLITGAVYVVGFGCFDEWKQVRGGDHGDHVINLKKIDALYEIFRQKIDDYFTPEPGVDVYTDYILGDAFGFKEHYVNFKLEIRQSMRSMWDFDMKERVEEFVARISKEQDFVYLTTNVLDRTEIIMEALDNEQQNR